MRNWIVRGWVKRKIAEAAGTGGLGLVASYAIVALVLFLLQWFPLTGIFLMMVAGMLWIGLLVHVMMAHIVWRVVRGTIAAAWLALPVVFYAGGYGLHVASVEAAKSEAAAIEAGNAALRLDVEQPFRFMQEGGAGANELLTRYRVDRAFQQQGKSGITTYYYARGAECDGANQRWDYKRRHEPYLRNKDIFLHYKGEKTRQCIISQDGLPADWRYRIKGNYTSRKNTASWLFTRYGRSYDIYDDEAGRLLGTVEVASFSPLLPVPFIAAGCALNSGAPSWDCFAGLMKQGITFHAGYKGRSTQERKRSRFARSDDPETWEISALAKALGLEPRQPTD